jgi:hypothetical protein
MHGWISDVALRAIAERHHATTRQVVLAWLLAPPRCGHPGTGTFCALRAERRRRRPRAERPGGRCFERPLIQTGPMASPRAYCGR